MIRPLLLALVLLGAAGATAQPSLVVSADTIRYPAETTFTVTNDSPDPVTLSFPITHQAFYGTTGAYEWDFKVETPSAVYDLVSLPYEEPPTIALSANAQATFQIIGFDSCPACDGGTGSGLAADTLYLRSADASGADTALVVLDLAGFVSAEPTAEEPVTLHLSAYPNPARHTLTVAAKSERLADVDLCVFDVLGREVKRARALATGREFVFDLGGLRAGLYVLQARDSGSDVATARFIVVR